MAAFQKRSGSWRAIIRKIDPFTEKLVSESKGGFKSKPAAQAWAQSREEAIEKGVHASVAEAETMTLSMALERYERDVTPLKKGAKQEKLRIAAWKRSPLASRSLSSIRGSDIAEWRDNRLKPSEDRKKPISPTTVRNDLALISHVFTIATKEWGLESLSNPVEKIKMPAAGRARDRRLDPKPDKLGKDGKTEVSRLLEACRGRPVRWLEPLVRLAIETAMRQGELLSLDWKNVDLDKKVAKLLDTKNGEARDVPLSTEAVKALEDSVPTESGVVPLRVGPVFPTNTDQVVYEFRKAREAAKIVNLRFHDLRHEATSRMFEKGLNPMETASVTGHKTLQMLKRYTHLRAEDLAKKLG